MDFVIPAKGKSERVANKNYREFVDGRSLVDLVIEKLLRAGVARERIHLSCEDATLARPSADRYGIRYLPRSDALCDNSVPLTDWIRGITAQVPGEADIAWCQVCDPLFDDYSSCLSEWQRADQSVYDSLVVCYAWQGYLMTADGQPIGWSFGQHHTPSQRLPLFRTMPFTLSILTRAAIERTGYHIGERPLWVQRQNRSVDIDTERDFLVASEIYRACQTSCDTTA